MKQTIRCVFFWMWLDLSSLFFSVFPCSLFRVALSSQILTAKQEQFVMKSTHVVEFMLDLQLLAKSYWEAVDPIGWFVSMTSVDIQIQTSWIEQARTRKWGSHLLAIIVISSSIMRHFRQFCGFETHELWCWCNYFSYQDLSNNGYCSCIFPTE